jgi:hypothetical protein
MNQALQDLIAALKKADWDKAPVHIAGSDFTPVEVGNVVTALNELINSMEIIVRRKTVYGNDVIYPVCDTAQCLTMLGDTKTLTQRQIGIIKALGYKIVLEQQEEV